MRKIREKNADQTIKDKMSKLQRIINLSLENVNVKSTQISVHRTLESVQNCNSP